MCAVFMALTLDGEPRRFPQERVARSDACRMRKVMPLTNLFTTLLITCHFWARGGNTVLTSGCAACSPRLVQTHALEDKATRMFTHLQEVRPGCRTVDFANMQT